MPVLLGDKAAARLAQLIGGMGDRRADAGPGGAAGPRLPGSWLRWVRITSTTPSGNLYPGKVLAYDPGGDAYSDYADCHVRELNGASLTSTGTRYLGLIGGVHTDGVPIFHADLDSAGSGGATYIGARFVNTDATTIGSGSDVAPDWNLADLVYDTEAGGGTAWLLTDPDTTFIVPDYLHSWHVTLSARFEADGTGVRRLTLATDSESEIVTVAAVSGQETCLQVTYEGKPDNPGVVYPYFYQSSGGDLDITYRSVTFHLAIIFP